MMIKGHRIKQLMEANHTGVTGMGKLPGEGFVLAQILRKVNTKDQKCKHFLGCERRAS